MGIPNMRLQHTALLVLCLACENAAAPAPDALFPAQLRLVAEAHSVGVDGLRVDCYVETVVTLTGRVIYAGSRTVQFGAGGGEASRYRDVSTDRAVQFWADTHFPNLEFHLVGGDSVEVRSPESESTPERFWREFAVWGGRRVASPTLADPVLASGTWTCYPMDTPPSSGEYYDAEGIAVGTWSLLTRD